MSGQNTSNNTHNCFIVHACVLRSPPAEFEVSLNNKKHIYVWSKGREVHFSVLTSATKCLAECLAGNGRGLHQPKMPVPTHVQFLLMPYKADCGINNTTDITVNLADVKKSPFLSFSIPISEVVKGVYRALPKMHWDKHFEHFKKIPKDDWLGAENQFMHVLKKAVDELTACATAVDAGLAPGNVVLMEDEEFMKVKQFWEPFRTKYLLHVAKDMTSVLDLVRDLQGRVRRTFNENGTAIVRFSLLTSDTRSLSHALVTDISTCNGNKSTVKDKAVHFTLMPFYELKDSLEDPTNISLYLEQEVNRRSFLTISIPIVKNDQGVEQADPNNYTVISNNQKGEGLDKGDKEWFLSVFREAVRQLTRGDWDELSMPQEHLDKSKTFWELWEE